jgi:hypothetical protein
MGVNNFASCWLPLLTFFIGLATAYPSGSQTIHFWDFSEKVYTEGEMRIPDVKTMDAEFFLGGIKPFDSTSAINPPRDHIYGSLWNGKQKQYLSMKALNNFGFAESFAWEFWYHQYTYS